MTGIDSNAGDPMREVRVGVGIPKLKEPRSRRCGVIENSGPRRALFAKPKNGVGCNERTQDYECSSQKGRVRSRDERVRLLGDCQPRG